MIIRDRTRLIVLLEFFTSGGIMLRELLHIGPVTIYGYGLMVAIGVISCVLVGMNRAKKLGVNPDILFKLLRNGGEATLPQLHPVSGPYYKWSEFKEWASSMMKAHPRIERQ